MNWGRRRNNGDNNLLPDFQSYSGSLNEYESGRKRNIFHSGNTPAKTDMQIGDRYSFTEINVYVDARGKNRVPDAEQLYQDILRKRKGGRFR